MKRIAVLIHGQPRFLNYTWKYIKEEYSVPGYDTYYFGHLWEDVGFVPDDCLHSNYIKQDIKSEILKQFTDVSITNYEILDEVTKNFHPKISLYLHNKIKTLDNIPGVVKKLRYRYGQHVSKQLCYDICCAYESKHNIKFDILVVIKTDFVYKRKNCYKNPEKYDLERLDLYKNLKHNSNIVKNVTICYEEWESWTKMIKKYNAEISTELPKHSIYNRLLLNDHWLLGSRDAMGIYCTKWFETHELLLQELINDRVDKKYIESIPKKYGCPFIMQGEIGLKNKITIERVYKRFKRIVLLNNCKEKFLPNGKNGREVIHNQLRDIPTEQAYIEDRLIEIFT